jgi:hypothetical protein
VLEGHLGKLCASVMKFFLLELLGSDRSCGGREIL